MKANKLVRIFLGLVLLASAVVAEAASLAFVGFNADGTDGYSLATLEDIATGTIINFTDDEWNGAAFADANEADWAWTVTTDVPAGTVVNFLDMANVYNEMSPASVSTGTLAGLTFGSNNAGYSNSAEVIYAFTGTRATPTFLAAISTENAANFSFGGLTGAQAIQLPLSSDGAKYIGPRTAQPDLSFFLPLIADVASNWSNVGNGTGDNNFDPTPFTTPEPSSVVLLGLSLAALGLRRS
ncbi:MAG: PEP-CTERM sorting domain-containing protein [Bythopirellula sp.]|nr:PEP-CTERM sorting domain-containing protein [Bythopirellula sp.]